MAQKYIVVTGGVLSGIGKGVTAASLGRLLKHCGVKIDALKMDPYLNVDPGTMNPQQHGEVFVTEDGYEADLDLGHYERFLGEPMTRANNITAGQIYLDVITKEREGAYLGQTVQMVPHVTGAIKNKIRSIDTDVLMIEVGGTIGDIEGEIFFEALRDLAWEEGKENIFFIHVAYIPYLRVSHEFKTKPIQQAVQKLRSVGIPPDMIVVRSEDEVDESSLRKIAFFAGLKPEVVINLKDISSIYEIPFTLEAKGVHHLVAKHLGLNLQESHLNPNPNNNQYSDIHIALVAKYISNTDTYKSITESLKILGVRHIDLVDAELLENKSDDEVASILQDYNGLIIPGGFGKRGIEGKMRALHYARVNNVPLLGICLGMQLMVIEYARNVLRIANADSSERNPETSDPIIDMMAEQKNIMNLGGTMRLGAQSMKVISGTHLYEIYDNKEDVIERHRHRFEVNHEAYPELFAETGNLVLSARSGFVEAVELKDHPFYIGVQYHPEFISKLDKVNPLFEALVKASLGS